MHETAISKLKSAIGYIVPRLQVLSHDLQSVITEKKIFH